MSSEPATVALARIPGAVDPSKIAAGVRRAVEGADAACVVEGLPLDPDHRSLLALCGQLGTPAVDSVTIVSGKRVEIVVQRVEHNGDRHWTRDGSVRLSATEAEFPCHTDCASDRDPPDLVLLHCARPDPHGGASTVVPVEMLVPGLPAEVRAALSHCRFPFAFGRAAVLEEGTGGARVRYNRHEIDKTGSLDRDMANSLDVLDEALRTATCRAEVHLTRGDCLVVDNHRALHGRRAFTGGSGRLLHRARVFT
jgi:alpha-ketoglutarate-dependent taurine dioxygenase